MALQIRLTELLNALESGNADMVVRIFDNELTEDFHWQENLPKKTTPLHVYLDATSNSANTFVQNQNLHTTFASNKAHKHGFSECLESEAQNLNSAIS